MKSVNKLITTYIIFLIFSCSGGDDVANPGNPDTSNNDGNTNHTVTSIVLSSNQSSYLVGQAAFFVVRDQQNSLVTNQASIFVNGEPVNVNPYLFSTTGSYEFVANYQGVTSNTLNFEVVSASDYSDTTSFVPDGAPESFTKKVLLEDFTGTWCPQCPPAAAAISSATQDANIFGVGYHYNDPMQITETIFWTDYYNVTGFPTVYVNGPDTRWNYPNMAQVNSELAEEATVGLAVEANLVGGKLDLEVSVGFKSTPSEEVKLMIYLIEGSSTSTSAQSGSSAGVNYIHKDILREVYTNQLGDVISAVNTTAGGIYTRTITGLDLPSDITDFEDLKILAFVRNTYNKTFTDFFNVVWENSPHYDIYNLQEAQLGESVSFD